MYNKISAQINHEGLPTSTTLLDCYKNFISKEKINPINFEPGKITISKSKYRMLFANRDLIDLHKNNFDGKVTEYDLKNVLRRYNIRECLIKLGEESARVFDTNDENSIGNIVHKDPFTGVMVSEFSLAYLANLIIISGSNDYKSKNINDKDNCLILCNIHSNCLVEPALTDLYKMTDQTGLTAFTIRMSFEQISLQFESLVLISRNIILFLDLINTVKTDKFDNLSNIFQKETGISILDYFKLVSAVFAGINKNKKPIFNREMFINADIEQMKDVLNEHKVDRFLNILSANYNEFRDKDFKFNKNLDPIFTKYRFNPLNIYPIIKTDIKNVNDNYVVPNIVIYIRKAFGGLFWWFDNYFNERKQIEDFRKYFGLVFEKYAGIILSNIYGECNVRPEIPYGKDNKFFDWIVDYNNKTYLFEIKAYQFSLSTLQNGYNIDKEISKIVYAIKQVFKKLNDIKNYKELEFLRKRAIVPIIVFMDIPLISNEAYKELIIKKLKEEECKDSSLIGLKDFYPILMNIDELECFDSVVDEMGIEDIFDIIKKNPNSESFLSIINKKTNNKSRNSFLQKTFDEFFEEMLKIK